LQIDAGHATEVDIKDKAVYRRFGIASEKGLGGCILLGQKTVGVEQPPEAAP
jgi:hypothetical protein